jgi:hypothetical protein
MLSVASLLTARSTVPEFKKKRKEKKRKEKSRPSSSGSHVQFLRIWDSGVHGCGYTESYLLQ